MPIIESLLPANETQIISYPGVQLDSYATITNGLTDISSTVAAFDKIAHDLVEYNLSSAKNAGWNSWTRRKLRTEQEKYFSLVEEWIRHFRAPTNAPFDISKIIQTAHREDIQLDARTIDMAITLPPIGMSSNLAYQTLTTQRLTGRQYALALLNGGLNSAQKKEKSLDDLNNIQIQKGMTEKELDEAKTLYDEAVLNLGNRSLLEISTYKMLLSSVTQSYDQKTRSELKYDYQHHIIDLGPENLTDPDRMSERFSAQEDIKYIDLLRITTLLEKLRVSKDWGEYLKYADIVRRILPKSRYSIPLLDESDTEEYTSDRQELNEYLLRQIKSHNRSLEMGDVYYYKQNLGQFFQLFSAITTFFPDIQESLVLPLIERNKDKLVKFMDYSNVGILISPNETRTYLEIYEYISRALPKDITLELFKNIKEETWRTLLYKVNSSISTDIKSFFNLASSFVQSSPEFAFDLKVTPKMWSEIREQLDKHRQNVKQEYNSSILWILIENVETVARLARNTK